MWWTTLSAVGFVIAFAATVVTAVLTARGLGTIDPPMKMNEFEMIGTYEGARVMMGGWNADEAGIVRRSIYWDFAFIFCYSITLAWAAAWAVCVFRAAGLNPGWLAGVIVAAPIVAGLLDAVEDMALLRMLGGAAGEFFPRTAMFAAALKFMLVGYAALFAFAGLVVRVNAWWLSKR